jgi:hypothetical protein
MTTPASPGGAEPQPSMLGAACLWLWRLLNTALLAAAVWVLWRQTTELAVLNSELSTLIDYLSVIAERIG